MPKALIVYASRTGNTQRIAEFIAEGLRMAGLEAELKKATEIKSPQDLQDYEVYLFGSATYHGEMLGAMKQLLFLAEKANLEGKCGGSFGSYGWSGEAPQRIFETMQHVFKMKMGGDCLRLKSAALEGGPVMAQSYGQDMARLVG